MRGCAREQGMHAERWVVDWGFFSTPSYLVLFDWVILDKFLVSYTNFVLYPNTFPTLALICRSQTV